MTNIDITLYVKKNFVLEVLKHDSVFLTYADFSIISAVEYQEMIAEFKERNIVKEIYVNVYSETKSTRQYYQLLCRITSGLNANSIYLTDSYSDAISKESQKQIMRGAYLMLKQRYTEHDDILSPIYRMMFYKSYAGYIAFGSLRIPDDYKGYYIIHQDDNPAIPVKFVKEKPNILQYGVFITKDIIASDDLIISDFSGKIYNKDTRKTFVICNKEYDDYVPKEFNTDYTTVLMNSSCTKFMINPVHPSDIYSSLFNLIESGISCKDIKVEGIKNLVRA